MALRNGLEGGLRKEQRRRGVDPSTPITFDNYQILLTEDGLSCICNEVSRIVKRKLHPGEIAQVRNMVAETPASRLNGASYEDAARILARDFVHENVQGHRFDGSNRPLVGTLGNDDDQRATLGEYQRGELLQMTPDESAYATRAHADRRGNALVDRDRVAPGPNSAPHNLKPLRPEAVQRVTHDALKALDQFLNPTSIDQTLNRLREGYHRTFLDLELARQALLLDSRYRRRDLPPQADYSWYVHPAGFVGTIGDVRTQDTLQQIMAMRTGVCFLPLPSPTLQSYYGTVRLLVREFASQSIQATQFLTPVGSPAPTDAEISQDMFHFEYTVESVTNGRARLKPVAETFYFRKPFARVETLTLIWRTPYELLVPQVDLLGMTMTFANPTTLTSVLPHGLAAGDLVYIENSDSGDAALDATFTQHAGFLVTVVSSTTVSIPVDSSTLVGTQVVQVYLGSRRYSLQLSFTCLQQ